MRGGTQHGAFARVGAGGLSFLSSQALRGWSGREIRVEGHALIAGAWRRGSHHPVQAGRAEIYSLFQPASNLQCSPFPATQVSRTVISFGSKATRSARYPGASLPSM